MLFEFFEECFTDDLHDNLFQPTNLIITLDECESQNVLELIQINNNYFVLISTILFNTMRGPITTKIAKDLEEMYIRRIDDIKFDNERRGFDELMELFNQAYH